MLLRKHREKVDVNGTLVGDSGNEWPTSTSRTWVASTTWLITTLTLTWTKFPDYLSTPWRQWWINTIHYVPGSMGTEMRDPDSSGTCWSRWSWGEVDGWLRETSGRRRRGGVELRRCPVLGRILPFLNTSLIIIILNSFLQFFHKIKSFVLLYRWYSRLSLLLQIRMLVVGKE